MMPTLRWDRRWRLQQLNARQMLLNPWLLDEQPCRPTRLWLWLAVLKL